jgi:hypothetical protein
MGIGDERRGIPARFMGFDSVSVAIVIFVGLVILAYNYGVFFPQPSYEQAGLLNRINASNVFLYVIVFLAGAALFVRVNRVDLSERIKITNASLLAILASFFIFASIYYFVAGFNDTFISPSNAQNLRQTYGWVLEFLLYIAVAIILLQLSKRLKRAAEREFVVRTYPVGSILGVFFVIMLFIGFTISEASDKTGMVMQIKNLENIFEILVFGGLAYFFIWTEDSILRRQELTNENLYAPAIALGVCCVIISVISYVAAVMQYVEVGGDSSELFPSLAGAVVIGVLGVFLTVIASLLFRTNADEHIVSPMLFLFGATYAIFAIVELFMGFDDFLKNSDPNFRWIIAVVLFLLPAVLAYFIAPIARRKSEEYYGRSKPTKKA